MVPTEHRDALGFLVAHVLRRSLGWAAGPCLATSLLIETAQGTALWGAAGLSSVRTGVRAGPIAPAIRFVVRWLPMMVLGPGGTVAVTVVELAAVAVRRDRRSLPGWLVGATTRTRNDLAGVKPAPGGPVSS